MSLLTPVVTFSRSPTFPPFFPLLLVPPLPFVLFWSAIFGFRFSCATRESAPAPHLYARQERSGIVEVRWLAFGPGVKLGRIHQNLTVRSQFDVGAVHRTGSRAFEVDSFTVVSTAVARTLELVFARLPIRGATEMGAARVDHKKAVGGAVNPDAIFLLELGVDAEREFRRIADLENGVGFEKSAGKKETEEGQEPCQQESGDHGPDKAPAMAIDFGGGGGSGDAAGGSCFRGSDRWCSHIFRGVRAGFSRRFRHFRIRIDLVGLQLRHESSSASVRLRSSLILQPSRTAEPPASCRCCGSEPGKCSPVPTPAARCG